MHEDIFLGELPQDTTDDTTLVGNDEIGIAPDEQQEDAPAPQNNWIMYLGVGLMAYILLFKNK